MKLVCLSEINDYRQYTLYNNNYYYRLPLELFSLLYFHDIPLYLLDYGGELIPVTIDIIPYIVTEKEHLDEAARLIKMNQGYFYLSLTRDVLLPSQYTLFNEEKYALYLLSK